MKQVQPEMRAYMKPAMFADPVASLRDDPRLGRLVDRAVEQVAEIARAVHSDLFLDVFSGLFLDDGDTALPMSVRDIIGSIIKLGVKAHGDQSLWMFVQHRWVDTLAMIEIYEDKTRRRGERLRVKPALKARGFL